MPLNQRFRAKTQNPFFNQNLMCNSCSGCRRWVLLWGIEAPAERILFYFHCDKWIWYPHVILHHNNPVMLWEQRPHPNTRSRNPSRFGRTCASRSCTNWCASLPKHYQWGGATVQLSNPLANFLTPVSSVAASLHKSQGASLNVSTKKIFNPESQKLQQNAKTWKTLHGTSRYFERTDHLKHERSWLQVHSYF